MIISCIEGRHFLFNDRGYIFVMDSEGRLFLSMEGAKIFLSHMVEARICVYLNISK